MFVKQIVHLSKVVIIHILINDELIILEEDEIML